MRHSHRKLDFEVRAAVNQKFEPRDAALASLKTEALGGVELIRQKLLKMIRKSKRKCCDKVDPKRHLVLVDKVRHQHNVKKQRMQDNCSRGSVKPVHVIRDIWLLTTIFFERESSKLA